MIMELIGSTFALVPYLMTEYIPRCTGESVWHKKTRHGSKTYNYYGYGRKLLEGEEVKKEQKLVCLSA